MSSVIVLNRNYAYHREVSIKKVLSWMSNNKIEIVLEKDDEEILGVEIRIKMPLVVRLLGFIGYKVKRNTVQYSPKAVFDRDNNVCQYWHYDKKGKKFKYQCSEEDRTIDHVYPKSLGGGRTFENNVCCCLDHNGKVKKNMSPEQAGLVLIRKPVAPRVNKGDFAVFKFAYNPNKVSHKAYLEQMLSREFSHVIKED